MARKFSYRDNGVYRTGVRSDDNGPTEMAEYINHDIINDTPFNLYYKVAKPYYTIVGSEIKPFTRTLETEDGQKIFFSMPSTDKFLEPVMARDLDNAKTAHELLMSDEGVINNAIKASQAYGELLMLVSANEAKQTVRMLRNIFIRLFNVMKDIYLNVKKLDLEATLDVLANVWLEYRYGWKPLIAEMQSLHKALTIVRPEGIKSAFGTDKIEVPYVDNITYSDLKLEVGNFIITYDFKMGNFRDITLKAGFNYVNKPASRNDSWAAIFGIDFDSILSTGWESIPFSFIVDMFLNIGDVLQMRDFADQVAHFNGYETRRVTGDGDIDITKIELADSVASELTEDFEIFSPRNIEVINRIMWMKDKLDRKAKADQDNQIVNLQYLDTQRFKSFDSQSRVFGVEVTLGEPGGAAVFPSRQWNPNNDLFIHNVNRCIFGSNYGHLPPPIGFSRAEAWEVQEKLSANPAIDHEIYKVFYSVTPANRLKSIFSRCDDVTQRVSGNFPTAESYENMTALFRDDPITRKFFATLPLRAIMEDRNPYNDVLVTGTHRKGGTVSPIVGDQLKVFRTRIEFSMLERRRVESFDYTLTYSSDLSGAQTADLVVFARQFGNYFKSLK